jgi:hypothetical protein
MSTSPRNKLFALLLGLLVAPSFLRASGTIDDISALPISNAPYTAGVPVNSAGTGNINFVINAGTQPPSGGQLVTLQLFSGSTLIPNGIAPSSFTTPSSPERAVYGGGGGATHPVFIEVYYAGSNLSIRAASAANPAVFDQTSTFTVVPNSPTKLIAFVPPDMTFAPGTNGGTGSTGSALKEPFENFTVRVNQTDNWFNLVTAGSPTVGLSASGDLVTLPGSAALVSGTADFSVSIAIAKSERTIFADVVSGPARSQGSVLVRTAGPEKETVFPFPSPFNPHVGTRMNFRFQLNEATTAKVIVKDQFGQDVWRTEHAGSKGQNTVTWDGRNERGHVAAAGIYYVLLEVNGEITSKKRFGVVK